MSHAQTIGNFMINVLGNVDDFLLTWVNGFMGRSKVFDAAVEHILLSQELKLGVVVAAFYWLWFRRGVEQQEERSILTITALSGFVGIAVTRLLVMALPFRQRPLVRPELHFHLPPDFDIGIRAWSSFPSDHAVLAFALATGIWLISRPLGAWAFLHAAVIVCLPRIYFGLHHPTDVIAGALIGVSTTLVLTRPSVSRPFVVKVLYAERRHRGPFYLVFFLFMLQITTLFDTARWVVTLFAQMLGYVS
jgi:undecaprenyl-diphosphatase